MGYRLSKIYTRTGDQGTTGLGDNTRVDKDCPRVEAYGTVDELNCAIGLTLSQAHLPHEVSTSLTRIQNELFDLGSELCIPGYSAITATHVEKLEHDLDALNEHLKPLKEFILPGGTTAASHCQMARAICRRAERRTISLTHGEQVTENAIAYLNRLSDFLFVCARYINQQQNVEEPLWQHERVKKS